MRPDLRPLTVPASSSLSALARFAIACIVVYPPLLPPSRVSRIKERHKRRKERD